MINLKLNIMNLNTKTGRAAMNKKNENSLESYSIYKDFSTLENLFDPEKIYNINENYDPHKVSNSFLKKMEVFLKNNGEAEKISTYIVLQKRWTLLSFLHLLNITLAVNAEKNARKIKKSIKTNTKCETFEILWEIDSDFKNIIEEPYIINNTASGTNIYELLTNNSPLKILQLGNPHSRTSFNTIIHDIFESLLATKFPPLKSADGNYSDLKDKIITSQILDASSRMHTRKIHIDNLIYYDYPISMIGNLFFQVRRNWYKTFPLTNNKKLSLYDASSAATHILIDSADMETLRFIEQNSEFKNYCKNTYKHIQCLLWYIERLYSFLSYMSKSPYSFKYILPFNQKDFPECEALLSMEIGQLIWTETVAKKNFPVSTVDLYTLLHPFLAPNNNPKTYDKQSSINSMDIFNTKTKKDKSSITKLKGKELIAPILGPASNMLYAFCLNSSCRDCPYIVKANKELNRLERCSLDFGCLSCPNHKNVLKIVQDFIKSYS